MVMAAVMAAVEGGDGGNIAPEGGVWGLDWIGY
jgi:hypothetical protein